MVGGSLGAGGEVLRTAVVETAGAVAEGLREVGFVPVDAVDRFIVVTTLEVTEVEEAEGVAELEWPGVDMSEVVTGAVVGNLLASEGLVTEEVAAAVDVAGALGWVGVGAEVVEPLRAVAAVLGAVDVVMVVRVSAIVVMVLTSTGVETDVVAPVIVAVRVFDSVEIVTGGKPVPVVEEVSAVVEMEAGVVVSSTVVREELASAEVAKCVLVSEGLVDELVPVAVMTGVVVSVGVVEDELTSVGVATGVLM